MQDSNNSSAEEGCSYNFQLMKGKRNTYEQSDGSGPVFFRQMLGQGEKESLVYNLSSRAFTQAEIEVPTPGYNSFQTRVDVYKLIRNIKLKKFFENSNKDSINVFCPKSSFVPVINDPSIQVFENVLMRDIKNLEQQNCKPFLNLTKSQNEILKGIASDSSIVIREADKGGCYCLS